MWVSSFGWEQAALAYGRDSLKSETWVWDFAILSGNGEEVAGRFDSHGCGNIRFYPR